MHVLDQTTVLLAQRHERRPLFRIQSVNLVLRYGHDLLK